MVYIQLLSIKQIEIAGKSVTFHPGDWVGIGKHVGKQEAQRWINDGDAHIPNGAPLTALPPGCGIVAWGNNSQLPKEVYDIEGLSVDRSDVPELKFNRTLLWNGVAPLRVEKLHPGFVALDVWQMAVPLCDYDTLAVHVGTEVERNYSREIIGDLRVPLYETGLMWVKRCEETQGLLKSWTSGSDLSPLGFLRALFQCQPLILPLPYPWATAGGEDKYDR